MKSLFVMAMAAVGLIAGSCASRSGGVASLGNPDPYEFIVLDENQVAGEKTVKLSELVDDYRIVHFQNSDSTVFKVMKPVISDNYVAIIQGWGQPVLLFDRNGDFVCQIGGIGQGPGEYESIYDAVIDEENGKIYISNVIGMSVMEYELNGKYIADHKVGKLNKPALFLNDDGSISIASLAFGDMGGNELVTTATLNLGTDSVKSLVYAPLVSNFTNPAGEVVGLSNETWAYKNTSNNVFMLTNNDTLYAYDPTRNAIFPRAFLQEKTAKTPETWYQGLELPNAIMYQVFGDNRRVVWYDKVTGELFHVNLVDDYCGNTPIAPNFLRNGYFVRIWEPGVLMDRIEGQWLDNNDLTDGQRANLNELLESLNPDDNDVMFIGRLKTSN